MYYGNMYSPYTMGYEFWIYVMEVCFGNMYSRTVFLHRHKRIQGRKRRGEHRGWHLFEMFWTPRCEHPVGFYRVTGFFLFFRNRMFVLIGNRIFGLSFFFLSMFLRLTSGVGQKCLHNQRVALLDKGRVTYFVTVEISEDLEAFDVSTGCRGLARTNPVPQRQADVNTEYFIGYFLQTIFYLCWDMWWSIIWAYSVQLCFENMMCWYVLAIRFTI